ncbi:MAG: hypothetical protein QOE55_4410, partial [Acidobacteriaceae bacterium]|nr:hypothetical protein [Acidobacteriaceae bacterium]
PINKRIWTSTFALLSGGVSLLALGLLYWMLDVRSSPRWMKPASGSASRSSISSLSRLQIPPSTPPAPPARHWLPADGHSRSYGSSGLHPSPVPSSEASPPALSSPHRNRLSAKKWLSSNRPYCARHCHPQGFGNGGHLPYSLCLIDGGILLTGTSASVTFGCSASAVADANTIAEQWEPSG